VKILDICAMPTCVDANAFPLGPSKFHESLFRSYHILAKAKELLGCGVPPGVVLDLVGEMESAQLGGDNT